MGSKKIKLTREKEVFQNLQPDVPQAINRVIDETRGDK